MSIALRKQQRRRFLRLWIRPISLLVAQRILIFHVGECEVLTIADVIALPYTWLGAAGLAVIAYVGGTYHNWFLRRELRRIRIALERRRGGRRG